MPINRDGTITPVITVQMVEGDAALLGEFGKTIEDHLQGFYLAYERKGVKHAGARRVLSAGAAGALILAAAVDEPEWAAAWLALWQKEELGLRDAALLIRRELPAPQTTEANDDEPDTRS